LLRKALSCVASLFALVLLLGFQTNDTNFWWSAYGAAVDNVSGDSWSSHASQPGFGP